LIAGAITTEKSCNTVLTSIVLAAQVVFACKAFVVALADIQVIFLRDYLLESLEHVLDNSCLTSRYPRTTLRPGQRFVLPDTYTVNIANSDGAVRITSGVWIQP
jgi:hypothetical protein